MKNCRFEKRRLVRVAAAGAAAAATLLTFGAALLAPAANSGEKTAAHPAQNGPISIEAHYRLRYAGIEVGRLDVHADAAAKTYTLSGSSKISVLLGTIKWWGSTKVSGTIEGGAPAPTSFAFDWRQNRKSGAIRIGFRDRVASDIAIKPEPRVKSDMVPLLPVHKVGALDPMSAVLSLTKADSRPPCDRRVAIFDGKQRYDVVLTPKRTMRLPAASGSSASEIAHVCRIMYVPVAGHRDNADTKAYAANRDAELVLRRIPGSEMLIPYSINIPTSWGTGTMVTDRIDIVTPGAGRIALTE